MINESVFQRHLPEFEGRGYTVSQYMVPAYYWLGWGIKGYREQYAYDYSKKTYTIMIKKKIEQAMTSFKDALGNTISWLKSM